MQQVLGSRNTIRSGEDGVKRPWKHAGKPGSLQNTLNYAEDAVAFKETDIPAKAVGLKKETIMTKQPKRLGEKPNWNMSTAPDEKFQCRSLKRQISEYQAVKMVYNYRAEVLPDLYKQTLFLPKGNKLTVDQTHFLNPKDKPKAVKQNILLNSRAEIEVHPALAGKVEWDVTTTLDKRRLEDSMKATMEASLRNSMVKKERLKNYISPIEREKLRMKEMRAKKMEERKQRMKELGGSGSTEFQY